MCWKKLSDDKLATEDVDGVEIVSDNDKKNCF